MSIKMELARFFQEAGLEVYSYNGCLSVKAETETALFYLCLLQLSEWDGEPEDLQDFIAHLSSAVNRLENKKDVYYFPQIKFSARDEKKLLLQHGNHTMKLELQ